MNHDVFREAWLWQARTCDKMGAPFTAAILRSMSENNAAWATVAPILAPYDADSTRAILLAALPMRILGGLHYLVLTGAAPDLAFHYSSGETDGLARLVAEASHEHYDTLARFMTSPPQTNEVRRSFCLVGGFLEAARATNLPLRCLELGASAGLNMNWDRYAYDLGNNSRWGNSAARLTLTGEWTGGLPPLNLEPQVKEKRACDQAPIDARTEEGALLLRSYIWPEQKERIERIRTAIAIARETEIVVEKADACDWVSRNGTPEEGVATVIYHSIFINYPTDDVRRAILAAIAEKGALATNTAPLAWLRLESKPENPVEVEVRLTLWPSGEDRRLAEVGPHGAPVRWLG